jgi:hypothetical protein
VSSRGRPTALRSGALIALGALAVHQLRYLLAFGSHTGSALVQQGHAYLLQALPILGGFAIALLAAGVVRAWSSASASGPLSATFRTRALLYAGAILAVFASQELLEGMLSAGHESGLAAIFGEGGWLALPLALLAGCLAALGDRGIVQLETFVAASAQRRKVRRPRPASAPRPLAPNFATQASAPLAFGLARRPPPLLR